MGNLSAAYDNNVLDAFLGQGFTKPATVYVALFVGSTEVSGGSYARIAVTNNATNWPNAASGQKANGTTITFPAPTANWGTVDKFRLYEHATSDLPITDAVALAVPRTISNGDGAPSFAASALTLQSV